MPSSMYPTNAAEWIAFLAAISPLVIWSIGGISKGREAWAARREAEWRRLHELALILYNNAHANGLWGQLLAVRELRRLRSRQLDAKALAASAAIFFRNNPVQTDGTRVLLAHLDEYVVEKPWWSWIKPDRDPWRILPESPDAQGAVEGNEKDIEGRAVVVGNIAVTH